MAWAKLVGRLSVQKKGDHVRLWRQKEPEDRDRHVSVPVNILRKAIEFRHEITEENPIEEESWKLSKCVFKGVEYLTFTFFDEHHARVGWKCFNLSQAESEQTARWLDCPEFQTEVNTRKRPSTGYGYGMAPKRLFQLEWTDKHYWEQHQHGNVLHKSDMFLSKANCESDLERFKALEQVEDSVYNIVDVPCEVPSAHDIVRRVYLYLMKNEYDVLIEKHCEGCRDEQPNQLAHECLSTETNLKIMRMAHLRISVLRLLEAAQIIGKKCHHEYEIIINPKFVEAALLETLPEKTDFYIDYEREYLEVLDV